jgi:alkylresorcinol/alkylpyrone synthase
MTRIAAVRSAFPPYRYPQAELSRAFAAFAASTTNAGDGHGQRAGGGGLDARRRALLERLFANSGVSARHTVLPLGEYARLGVPGGSVNDRYIAEATALGERALRAALAASGTAPGDLDLLIVTSVTGVAVPSLDAALIPRLGLRADIKRLPVFGLGCVAGAAGLARLHDYLAGWPAHTAALLAVELCTLCLPRTSVTTADMVASALFGDGAAAVVGKGAELGRAGTEQAGAAHAGTELAGGRAACSETPRIVATRSEVYPDSADALGWRLAPDGGFRIVLTTGLAEVIERHVGASVTGFLADHGLTVDDIGAWICHPGGPRVLDATQRALKLPDAAMALSHRSLAEAGNMSSVSVLHILELTAAAGVTPGTFGLMIGLGPGVSAELVLLRW